MKKKLLLLMFMVLMGAMSSWAGQVILDPNIVHGTLAVDNDFPAPGATVTLDVCPDWGYCMYISDLVIEEYDASDNYVDTINLSGSPVAFGPENYTFVMPADATHNVKVLVTFSLRPYNVGGNWNPIGGTVEISLVNGVRPLDPWNVQACMGDVITLGVNFDPGYYNVSYLVTADVGGQQDTIPVDEFGQFIMPSGDVNVEPTCWTQQYKVTLDPAITDGRVVPNPPFGNPGEEIWLDIYPDTGFVLYNLEGDNYPDGYPPLQMSFEDGRYRFNMPASDVRLRADFGPTAGGPYQVNVDPSILNGRITTNPTSGYAGDVIVVDVSDADPYFVIDSVFVDLFGGPFVSVFPSPYGDHTEYWFILPAHDVTVSATFRPNGHEVKIDPSITNGTVVPNPPFAVQGQQVILDVTPGPGYQFDPGSGFGSISVKEMSSSLQVPYTQIPGTNDIEFVMPDDSVLVMVTFRVATYSINVDQSILGGTVAAFNIPDSVGGPGISTVPAKMGDNIQLSNIPDRGYRFDHYIVTNDNDGSDVLFSDNNPGQTTLASDFFMPGNDVNVSAVFVPNVYPITLWNVSPSTGGNVNVPSTGQYGDQIPINIQPNAGYSIGQVYYEYRENGQTVRMTVTHNPLDPPDQYYFTMPAYHVRVTVIFDPAPYTINVVTFYTGGSISVDSINGVAQPRYMPSYTAGTGAVVDVINTPNTGYQFVQYELTSDYDPAYYVTFTTDSFTMPPHDVNLMAKFEPNQHKVVVQNVIGGAAEAFWLSATPIPTYDTGTNSYNLVPYNETVVLGLAGNYAPNPNFGYVFSHFELYEYVGGIQGRQLTTLWQNPPDNTDFWMPDCDVLVVPVFLPIDYDLTVDMTNWWGGWISAQDMTVVPPMTPIKSGEDWYDRPYPKPAATYPNAHIGDVIQLTNGRDWNPNIYPVGIYITFSYYVLTHKQYGYVIGEMTQSEFTMPPCGVIIGAQFHDDNYGIPPTNPVANWAWVTGRGRVLLHMETWLAKSKSSPDEEEQDTDLYGFARAVPGEPMHFVVQPNPGYQVKKNDITVRLLDVSQGEGGDEGKVLKEFKGGDGIEIFGPDELVTELTDYYFIFDVPEGVAPYDVKVEIYADFSPVDYTITVDGAIEHGTITAPAGANVDDIVTLTVNPEQGYRLESIMVLPEEPGFIVEVDQNNQFVMPPCNVTVTATFTEADLLIGDVNNDNTLDISDITTLIALVLSGEGDLLEGQELAVADINSDGTVDVTDVILLINMVLTGAW